MGVQRVLYAGIVTFVFLVNVFFVERQPLVLLLVLLILPLVTFVIALCMVHGLQIQTEVSEKTMLKGDTASFFIKVKNTFLPVPGIHVHLYFQYHNCSYYEMKEFCIYARAMDTTSLQRKLKAGNCGRLSIRVGEAYLYDFLHLWKIKIPSQQQFEVMVQPKLTEPDYNTLHKLNYVEDGMDNYSQNRSGNDPSEIYDIREYGSGDRMNQIHWKLSARMEELYVKEPGLPVSDTQVILVELKNCDTQEQKDQLDTVYELLYAAGNLECLRENIFDICFYSSQTQELKKVQVMSPQTLGAALELVMREEGYDGERVIETYLDTEYIQGQKIYVIRSGEPDEILPALDGAGEAVITVLNVSPDHEQQEFYRDGAIRCIWVDDQNIEACMRQAF